MLRTPEILHPSIFISIYRVDSVESMLFHWKMTKHFSLLKVLFSPTGKGISTYCLSCQLLLILHHPWLTEIISAKKTQFSFMLSSPIPIVITALLNSLSISFCFLTCQSQVPDPSHYSSPRNLAECPCWILVLVSLVSPWAWGYFFKCHLSPQDSVNPHPI